MILNLSPFDLYCKDVGAKSGRQHCVAVHWHMPGKGHTKVLNDFVTVKRIDYMVPRYNFTMGFATLILARGVGKAVNTYVFTTNLHSKHK